MLQRLPCPACRHTLALQIGPSRVIRASHARRWLATAATSELAIEVTDPMILYENMVRNGRIRWDEDQVRLLLQLKRVHQTLVDYEPSHTLRDILDSGSRKENTAPDYSPEGATTKAIIPNHRSGRSLVKALTHEDDLSTLDTPTGFMLTGSVGTGKTMLLDIFYQSLPVSKQRVHYHAFLLGLYRKVFVALEQQRVAMDIEDRKLQHQAALRKEFRWSRREENMANALTKGWQTVFAGGRRHDDPTLVKEFVLAKVALDMIKKSTVIAFDEVQLVDIAGAGILRRVLTWFWRLGGVVIATSNRVPSDLYQQGVQREQFKAFLEHLQTRCPSFDIRSAHDWRRQSRLSDYNSLDVYGSDSDLPAWASNFQGESSWFTDLASFQNCLQTALGPRSGVPKNLTVYGRLLKIQEQSERRFAKLAFSDLCEKALGPADYLTLTSAYPTIIVTDIPQLKVTAKNEARRFITFLDAAYENKTRLICLAATEPDEIFFPDAAEAVAREEDSLAEEMIGDVMQDLETPYRPNISSYTTTSVHTPLEKAYPKSKTAKTLLDASEETVPAFKTLAIFTGQDEQFAYKRALSRIYEITSKEYIKTIKHSPISAEDRVWEHDEPETQAPPLVVSTSAPQHTVEPETPDRPMPKYVRGQKVDPLATDLDVGVMPKPRIGTSHFWGVIDSWGAKAGRWGLGVRAKAKSGKESQEDW